MIYAIAKWRVAHSICAMMRFGWFRQVSTIVLTLLLGGMGVVEVCAQSRAKAWVVVDPASGQILLRERSNERLPVASLTKVATAMVVLDWAELTGTDLSKRVVLPGTIGAIGGANPVGLQPGDEVSLRDLLYCALMQSDNRAAHALALFVGANLGRTGSAAEAETAFVKQMNALARKLEMKRTGFINAHGLDQGDRSGLSTAEDMARLARYALGHRGFLFYVSQPRREIEVFRMGERLGVQLQNTNELLGMRDVGGVETKIDGLKTGMTARAGGCLIVSAERPPVTRDLGAGKVEVTPRRLVIVVLGSSDRFGVAGGLLLQGWRAYEEWARAGRPQRRNGQL